jgi:hypothetical protein
MKSCATYCIRLAITCAAFFAIAAPSAVCQQPVPDSASVDTASVTDTVSAPSLHRRDYALTFPATLADTIPPGFFGIFQNLGLNRQTTRLISRFNNIGDDLILQALAQADDQIEYKNINAYTAAYAINLLARQDSLWQIFFADLDMQFREPNILRFNFKDDQKWKSYALNDLFYSTFFQELLLRLGNIGIAGSRDGKQWLEGWPNEFRWKYREYRFEYLPEDVGIRVVDPARFAGTDTAVETSGTLRLNPNKPILPVTPSDTVEPPYRVPRP